MNTLFSIREKIVHIDCKNNTLSKVLSQQLADFISRFYFVENELICIEQLLNLTIAGELVIFYGEADEVIGFTRLYKHILNQNRKSVIVYTSKTFENQLHNIDILSARFGLTIALKDKLANPEMELIYIGHASSFEQFQLLTKLFKTMYPLPDFDMPESVVDLLKDININNHGSCISAKHPLRLAQQTLNPEFGSLQAFYLSLNNNKTSHEPLVCIPLHLSNISYAIKQLITSSLYDSHRCVEQQEGICT